MTRQPRPLFGTKDSFQKSVCKFDSFPIPHPFLSEGPILVQKMEWTHIEPNNPRSNYDEESAPKAEKTEVVEDATEEVEVEEPESSELAEKTRAELADLDDLDI